LESAKAMDIFQMKVLMLEERLKQKTLSALVILFTATGVAGLIHVGEF
jgi:hypothetical protein